MLIKGKTMDFVAIDVETANNDIASICQIGIASYANGELVSEWSSLINPQGEFNPFNIRIHGIQPQDVKKRPDIRASLSRIFTTPSQPICRQPHFFRQNRHRKFNPKIFPTIIRL